MASYASTVDMRGGSEYFVCMSVTLLVLFCIMSGYNGDGDRVAGGSPFYWNIGK